MSDTVSVRYIVPDVAAAADFYVRHFGFELDVQTPAFAAVIKGGLKLLLSGLNSAGGKPMSDGTPQTPGGWNRVMITVEDIDAEVARLAAEGVAFRGEVVRGPAGAIAVLDDASGNPVELFEPAEH